MTLLSLPWEGMFLSKYEKYPFFPSPSVYIGKHAFVFLFPPSLYQTGSQAKLAFPAWQMKHLVDSSQYPLSYFLGDSTACQANGLSLCYKIVVESWDVRGTVPRSSSCCMKISSSDPSKSKVGQEVPVCSSSNKGVSSVFECSLIQQAKLQQCNGWKLK